MEGPRERAARAEHILQHARINKLLVYSRNEVGVREQVVINYFHVSKSSRGGFDWVYVVLEVKL